VNIRLLITGKNNFIPCLTSVRTWVHKKHPTMSEDIFNFLSKSDSVGSDYVRLQDNDKRSVRLLSKPVTGYELFCDGKPVRWSPEAPRPEHAISDERPKKFLAFVVWEYDTESGGDGRIKVWSFTQRSIIDQMAMLFRDDHWTAYELVIVRQGKGMDTKYNLTGVKRPVEENLIAFAQEASKYIDLSKLYTGENPFIEDLPELSVEQVKQDKGNLPF